MDFHPRPWGVVRKSSPSCPRHMRPHGRGAAVSARCASRDSRTTQRIGRDAGNGVAQTERGGFRSSSLGGKSAPLPEHRFATRYRSGDMRSVSRLRRASPPKLGHCPCGARHFRPAGGLGRSPITPRSRSSNPLPVPSYRRTNATCGRRRRSFAFLEWRRLDLRHSAEHRDKCDCRCVGAQDARAERVARKAL